MQNPEQHCGSNPCAVTEQGIPLGRQHLPLKQLTLGAILQTVPQVPQLAGSNPVTLHTPLQLVVLAGQAQAPFWQVIPPVQSGPQLPLHPSSPQVFPAQFGVQTATQPPSWHVWPVGQSSVVQHWLSGMHSPLHGFWPLGQPGGGAATQLPPRQVPPAQGVPSGSVPLHLPFLRFLQGGHFFFFFLASVSTSPPRPRAPPTTAASAPRRERSSVSVRARASKRCASTSYGLLVATQHHHGPQHAARLPEAVLVKIRIFGGETMPPTIALRPLLVTAGVLSLVPTWTRVHTGSSGARLAAEVFVSTVVLAALLYGLIMAGQRLPW
jgi:hypothetical protein